MNITLNALSLNSILAIVAVIAAMVLIFAFIKRLISLIAITICLLLLYAGYLYYTGQRIPTTKEEILQHSQEQIQKIQSDKGMPFNPLLKNKAPK